MFSRHNMTQHLPYTCCHGKTILQKSKKTNSYRSIPRQWIPWKEQFLFKYIRNNVTQKSSAT
jgi:hypothetical protein